MNEKDIEKDGVVTDEGSADADVDDILADIYTTDGNYSQGFSDLFAKYLGIQADVSSITGGVNLADRSGEDIPHGRVEYDDPELPNDDPSDDDIDERLPESVREAYLDFSHEAQCPGFTPEGDVKYPTMGIGASEERVVFDADWEERARQEAARLDRVKRERMLRGDSPYARTFVTGSMSRARPVVNPAYIDPLSDDDDNVTFKDLGKNSYSKQKKKNDLSDIRPDWLIVEAENGAKRRNKGVTSVVGDDYTPPEDEFAQAYDAAKEIARKRKRKNTPEAAIAESEDLKSTVAQIVEKYNKREQEEEEKRAKAEEERLRLKKEREEREQALEEERKKLCSGVSRTVRKALETDSDEGYDNFSDADENGESLPNEVLTASDASEEAVTKPLEDENGILERLSGNGDIEDSFKELQDKKTSRRKRKKK